MRIGIYPGTFDPITNGHLDIIKRAAKLFDKVYVVVPNNVNKRTLFTVEERMEWIKQTTKDIPNVFVDNTSLLTVQYAKLVGSDTIIRGLRMVSDFEYELQMSALNKSLDNDIETIFIMSSHEYSFLSSSSVKEMVCFNADVSKFVPNEVALALIDKYNKK